MELEIKETKENKVLQRKALTGELSFTGATPSNKALQEAIAKKLGVKSEVVIVRHIYGKFGGGTAKFEAIVYDSKEQFDKIEQKTKKQKEAEAAAIEAAAKAKEEAAKAPEKKEAPKEEAKPAEKKEEVKEAPKEEKKEEVKEAAKEGK